MLRFLTLWCQRWHNVCFPIRKTMVSRYYLWFITFLSSFHTILQHSGDDARFPISTLRFRILTLIILPSVNVRLRLSGTRTMNFGDVTMNFFRADCIWRYTQSQNNERDSPWDRAILIEVTEHFLVISRAEIKHASLAIWKTGFESHVCVNSARGCKEFPRFR